ncbi:MAG: ABC transporter permease [Pseudomonadota bacterium]
MKQILLIAWREYKQYVLSRGFLLFLIMFPVGVIGAGAAVSFLEQNKPTRHFVVHDETGLYTAHIDRELDRRYLLSAVSAWDDYVAVNANPEMLEDGALADAFRGGSVNERRIQDFTADGGFEVAKRQIDPLLNAGAAPFEMPRPAFRRLPLPGPAVEAVSLEEVKDALRPYLLEERLVRFGDEPPQSVFAAILIPKGFGGEKDAPPAQYWSRNLTDQALEATITSALDTALRREAISKFGLSQELLDEVVAIDAPVAAFRPDRATENAELGLQDRIETALPAILTYMLLVIIFGVGNLLLTNTIEERSNKIVEILLSSVTANQLMMGKLIGIAAVGLTMPSIFLFGALAMSATSVGQENIMSVAVASLFSSNLIYIYLFYFLCAYVIFAMIFLAIGAISNSLQDAQSYMGPVMLIVFAPLPLMLLVFQNPNGVAASVLTWIPLYTPYAVMMRAAADPPLWEILGATAFMLAFAIFLMRIMGRIFRNAILQASPPKFREVWRLAKAGTA